MSLSLNMVLVRREGAVDSLKIDAGSPLEHSHRHLCNWRSSSAKIAKAHYSLMEVEMRGGKRGGGGDSGIEAC